MVYKPHAERKPRRPPTGEPVPSWQIPTDPESRWPAFGAAVVVIAGQAWVAKSLTLSPVWLFPVVSAVLLLASVGVYLPPRVGWLLAVNRGVNLEGWGCAKLTC